MPTGWSGKKAAEIAGITYRQLDYWARTDLVNPSLAIARGSGSRRQYSYRDLLELRVVKQLLDAGIRLETVRTVFTNLRDLLGEDVATANLVIDGDQVALARDGGELVDLIRTGQGVLNVLPLGSLKQAVDDAIVLFPGTAATEAPSPEAAPHDGTSASAPGASTRRASSG